MGEGYTGYQLKNPRIIARLDVKGINVIKGVHLEGLRVVAQPAHLARRYYEEGADEIVFLDSVASLYGRNAILPIVAQAAQQIFIPLTVGGGIRSIEDIVKVLRSGGDKVLINTAAIQRPEFLREAAHTFGSQCIVLSIEAKRRGTARWEALTNNGRERTGKDAVAWAVEAERLGVGEILLTSVDMEGTKRGFDIELFQAVRDRVHIPVIGSGGAGSGNHVISAVRDVGLDAVACATILHYNICSVSGIKAALMRAGVSVRR